MSKRTKSTRGCVAKGAPKARPQVTTIRLDQAVQEGLRVLEAHGGVRRPLNKWVNMALADLIERQAATLENELDQALQSIRAYRKTDPGYKRAIKAFINAEVAHAAQDPMEGSPGAEGMAGNTKPMEALLRRLLINVQKGD